MLDRHPGGFIGFDYSEQNNSGNVIQKDYINQIY
jgi:hypothetical protein